MEIYINTNDLEEYIRSYANENKDFIFSEFIPVPNKSEYLCNFFMKGKLCKVRFYIKNKKMSVKMVSVGNNAEETKLLMNYVAEKGYSIDGVPPKQTVFPCDENTINELIKYIKEEFEEEITIQYMQNNRTRFIGYNKDYIDITFYPTTNNAMLQGRPFKTYGIIITYLSQTPMLTLENIVEINNMFAKTKVSSVNIRNLMEQRLGDAYKYLDEALLKSLSGSLSSLEVLKNSEDYTCCVTGAFKTLEGYLTKILYNKYGYTIKNRDKFNMFFRQSGNPSLIDNDNNIGNIEKNELNSLYSIYSNKRNVFLHSTVDPSQTRIIEDWNEANDIVNEIIDGIEKSYKVFQ